MQNGREEKLKQIDKLTQLQEETLLRYHEILGGPVLTTKDGVKFHFLRANNDDLEEIRNYNDEKLLDKIIEGIKFDELVVRGIFGVSVYDSEIINLERLEAEKRAILSDEFKSRLKDAIRDTEKEIENWNVRARR